MAVESMVVCSFLGLCSLYDCRSKKIPLWVLYAGLALGSMYALIWLFTVNGPWYEVLLRIMPGVFMLVYSHLTEGKLGTADGFMALPVGLVYGWEICLTAIITACGFTFLAAVFLLVSGKGRRNTQIPFAPFLLLATVVLWMAGGYGG